MVATTLTIQLDESTTSLFERLARIRGISTEELVARFVKSAAAYEEELLRGIEEGLADADAKRFVSPDDARAAVRNAAQR